MEMKRKIAVGILCALLLLSGCSGEEIPEIPETEIWETAPVLTYGVMTYEKLEILPWYAGRAETVNKNYCAETELGFYIYNGNYRYMDKDNPVAWVPLYNKTIAPTRKTLLPAMRIRDLVAALLFETRGFISPPEWKFFLNCAPGNTDNPMPLPYSAKQWTERMCAWNI